MPELPQTTKDKADIAWFLYDLIYNEKEERCHLHLVKTVYTEFHSALERVIHTKSGNVDDFMSMLQAKFDERASNAPDARSIFELL